MNDPQDPSERVAVPTPADGRPQIAELAPGQRDARLRDSERALATLMSNLPGMAYRCRNDPQWSMEFVSEGCLRLTGHQASDLIENRLVAYGDLIRPDDRQAVWSQVQQALGERRAFQMEYRIRTAQGVERWVWEQGSGVFDAEGQLQALEGFITDTTAQKQAEAELRQARDELERRVLDRTAALTQANHDLQREIEQRRRAEKDRDIFRRFADASTQGFGMADLHGTIRYGNPCLARLFGIQRPEDLEGTQVTSYYPPSYAVRRQQEILPALQRGEYWRGEQEMLFPDGQLHLTLHTVFPVLDQSGQLFCTAVVITDITELKQTQTALRQSYEALAESEAKYRHLVEMTDTGFLILDDQGRVLDANAEYVRISGHRDRQEILGRPVTDWTAPQDAERNAREVAQCLQTGGVRQLEINYVLDDGTITPVEINASVVVAKGRQCILSLCRDITERKRAEELLRRQNELLKRSLLATDHQLRVIAYEIHDGLAQQLTGAAMQLEASAQLREQRKTKAAAEAFQEGLGLLRNSQKEARRLIRGVRPLTLDESGVVVALGEFIQGLEGKPGPQVELHSQVAFDRLDPKQENVIYRIVQEGVTNARRYSGSEKVRVELIQDGAQLRILIQDWGTGFDPAQRASTSFGLESIRERAKMLGGLAEIATAPGQGTRITVSLPVLPREADE